MQHVEAVKAQFRLSMACVSRKSETTDNPICTNNQSVLAESNKTANKSRQGESQDLQKLISALCKLGFVNRGQPTLRSILISEKTAFPTTGKPHSAEIERLCSFFHSLREHLSTNMSEKYSKMSNSCECAVYGFFALPRSLGETRSLKQLLRGNAERKWRETWVDKFDLARSLTLGFLRFQSTPWLKPNISTSDFHLFEPKCKDDDVEGRRFDLDGPYVRVQLSSEVNKRLQLPKNYNVTSHLAENESLFNLGVILLELGYDAPLQSLQRPNDIDESCANIPGYTDFLTALRLAKSAPRELYAHYGRIVKKCLGCEFGAGHDLSSEELQCAVVTDVVDELDRCMKSEKAINSLLGGYQQV